MAGAFDTVLAPAFTLSLKSDSDSSFLFNLCDSPIKLRVSAAAESAFSLVLSLTKSWGRLRVDDLIEVCERLNQRDREYHYAVGEPKADGVELRVKGWIGHQMNTKNWEPVIIALVDCMLRDFTQVERMLEKGNIDLPLALMANHRFAELIWPVIAYFSPKDYTLVCDEFGSDHFSANFDFSHNLKRVSSQRLKIEFADKLGNLRISLTHSEEGKVTKAKLTDLNLRSSDIKIQKGRLTAGTSIRPEASVLTGVLYVAQRYIHTVGVLMEAGVLKGRLPFPAAKVLYKSEEDLNFEMFLGDLEQLRPNVFEVLSEFQPQPCPPRWTLPAFREVLLPDIDRFQAILSEFRSFCLDLRFAVPRVHSELLYFDSERRTVLTDLSGLQLIAEIQAGAKDSYTLYRYMQELLGTMTDINKAGYEISRVKATWYENKYTNSTVVVPDLAKNQWSILSYQGGMGEDEGLEALAHLPLYLQSLGYEEALKLAEKVKLQETEARENTLIVAGLARGDSELAFFPMKTSTVVLNSLLRRLWWDYTKASVACSPQSLALFQIIRPEGITLGIRQIIDREAHSYASLPIDGKELILGHLYTYLEKTQKSGVGHLMLRPEVVFLSESTVKVREPQFSVFRLRKLKGDSADLAITELDFLDPSVITYIYLKRCSSSLKSQQPFDQFQSEAKKLEAKCRKYFRRITAKCDIYSFAMFIYTLIWPREKPFDYVWELEEIRVPAKLDEFYSYVVKPHRRPLIQESFENRFPDFTETLRRCFMKPDCRPTLLDLKQFIPRIPEFRKFVEDLTVDKH